MAKCADCRGQGVTPEYHGPGLTEMLGCVTCGGTGCVVDDAFILAVEEEVGMGNGAWDMVSATALCEAVLRVAALRVEAA